LSHKERTVRAQTEQTESLSPKNRRSPSARKSPLADGLVKAPLRTSVDAFDEGKMACEKITDGRFTEHVAKRRKHLDKRTCFHGLSYVRKPFFVTKNLGKNDQKKAIFPYGLSLPQTRRCG